MYLIQKEIEKLNLVTNIYKFSFVIFGLLSFINYFDNNIYFIQAVISFTISTICLIILVKFKAYKIVLMSTIFLSFFVHFIGFFTDSFVGNQTDLLWIITISFTAFYVLDKYWALTYLLINTSALILIKILSTNGYISPIIEGIPVNFVSILAYIINIVGSISIFIYVILHILKIYNLNENNLIDSLQEIKLKENEKSFMIKEIHHRVKNNLQVIKSLLRLQSNKIENEAIKQPFIESIQRVSTMSLIHTKMYKGDTLNQLKLKEYILDLSNDIIETYKMKNEVNLNINSTLDYLTLNDLVPFSLILNELITNSIKHGFDGNINNEINIDITDEKIFFKFRYSDNGKWKESTRSDHFGIELIETLCNHFDGEINLQKEPQTIYNFKFALN